MRLYYIQGSPFARMVRVLLRELNIACDEIEITDFPPPRDYFTINPLGQVPVLETDGGRLFPTSVILEFLMSMSPMRHSDGGDRALAILLRREDHYWRDGQLFAALLTWGDFVCTSKYMEWAGLRASDGNVLGFVPAERNRERISTSLDWLESVVTPSGFLPEVLSVQDIVFACFILWTESRGPIEWHGRPKLEALVTRLENRPSFRETAPQPWRPHPLVISPTG